MLHFNLMTLLFVTDDIKAPINPANEACQFPSKSPRCASCCCHLLGEGRIASVQMSLEFKLEIIKIYIYTQNAMLVCKDTEERDS